MSGFPRTGGVRPGLAPGHAFEAFEMRTVEVTGTDCAMEMEVTPQVVNGSGVLQGGLLATLIDMVAGTAPINRSNSVSETRVSPQRA